MTASDLILQIEKSPKWPLFEEFLEQYETDFNSSIKIYFRNLDFDFQWGVFQKYILQYCVLESAYVMHKSKIIYRLYLGKDLGWIEDIESLEEIVIAFFKN